MVRSLHGLRETTKTNSLPPSLRHQRLLLMTFPGKTTRDFSFLFFFFRTAFNAERHEVVFEFEGGKGGGEDTTTRDVCKTREFIESQTTRE